MTRPIEIRVHLHDLRWEVSNGGVTRPRIDWLCTRERAIEHAREMASELTSGPAAPEVVVIVEHSDGSVEGIVAPGQQASPERDRSSRWRPTARVAGVSSGR